MAYNATLLAEARLGRDKLPSTWEELADAAEKFTGSGPGRWGVIFPNQPVALTTQTTWSFMMQNGAELVSPDGSAPAFNTEATREVFQFATDLVQTWKVSPVKTYGLLDTWNDYGTGNVGAVNLYPAWIGNIKTFGFETVTAPMPKKKQPGTQFAGNYFTLAARSQKREPFARFVEWWARPEVNARWCMETGAIPIRRSVIDLPTYQDYLKREPLVKPFIDSIPFARPWPGVVGITGLLQVLAEAWESSILGKMKPREAIERAEKRAGDELKRAQAQYRS
jgi:multiple sugar transport system substrate-binding protein